MGSALFGEKDKGYTEYVSTKEPRQDIPATQIPSVLQNTPRTPDSAHVRILTSAHRVRIQSHLFSFKGITNRIV